MSDNKCTCPTWEQLAERTKERDQARAELLTYKSVTELAAEYPNLAEYLGQTEKELAELRKDRERLDYCDTVIDLEPDSYVLRFPVAQSCTIRQAIDAARSQP